MGNDLVCFNPDLLSTNLKYRDDVDELTTGSLVYPDDPCIPANEVPASFTASGLDPEDPLEVSEYVSHIPYYQTAACLWERAKFADSADPKNVRPVPVDNTLWRKNPADVIHTLASLPSSDDATRTIAYILTAYPQNHASLGSISEYFDISNYIASFQACTDPVLFGAYQLSSNAVQKEDFASGLARQFRNSSLEDYHDAIEPLAERSAIQRELFGQTLPVLRTLFKTTNNWQMRELSAKAIAAIGGPADLGYLARQVIERFPTEDDKSSEPAYMALEALMETAKWRPEVIPHLEEILTRKYDLSEPRTQARYKGIYETVLIQLHGLPWNPRLAECIYKAVVAIRGEFSYDRMYEVLDWFLKNDKDKGIGYLAKLVTRGNMEEEFTDRLAPIVLNHIGDPRIKKALKAVLKDEFEPRPANSADGWTYRVRLINRLPASQRPEDHQLLLGAMDETKDSEYPLWGAVVQIFNENSYQGGPRFAGEYFKRFMAANRSDHYDQFRRDSAANNAIAIAEKFPQAIVKNFASFDPVEKDWLIDRWALHVGESGTRDPLTQNYLPADIKRLIRAKREGVIGPGAARKELERAITDPGYVSVYLRSQLIDRLAKDESNLDFLIELATRQSIGQAIRFRIAAAFKDTPGTRVDDFLLNAMHHLDVKDYAGEALKVRAQNPKFAEHANEVLEASLVARK